MTSIFLCYRRADSQSVTSRIFDCLESEFGAGSVFRDVDSISPGDIFPTVIKAKLKQCQVIIVVIGTVWLDAADEKGNRRLDNPEDYVRLEIETAWKEKIHVVPLLVNGAAMPQASKLPDSLKALSSIHADPIQGTIVPTTTVASLAFHRI